MRHFLSDRLTIEPGFFIQLAIAVLLLPLNWVGGWLFAAAFHELCHYVALRLFNVRVYTMRISFTGAIIETEPMQVKHELISSLAGPLGGICLLTLLRIFPPIAISALLQSTFNLLPVYPFDGGRALIALFSYRWGREQAEIFFRYIQIIIFLIILLFSVILSHLWNLGLLPIVLSLLLLIRSFLIKTPCKQIKQIVQ